MRNFVFFTSLLLMPLIYQSAQAQDYAPRKTWDAGPEKRQIQPLNLKSILRGDKQRTRQAGPTSRNPKQVLKEGGELPSSPALSDTALYTPQRGQMRIANNFHAISEEETLLLMAEASLSAEENKERQRSRRAEFYTRNEIPDKAAREYMRTANGRKIKKKMRDEARAEIRAEKEKMRLEKAMAKEGVKEKIKIAREKEREEERSRPRVIRPTAAPDESGTIRPFFYR